MRGSQNALTFQNAFMCSNVMRTWAKSLAQMQVRIQYVGETGQRSSLPTTPEQSSLCEEHKAWFSRVSRYASYSSQAPANQNLSGPPVEHKVTAVMLHREYSGEPPSLRSQAGSRGPSCPLHRALIRVLSEIWPRRRPPFALKHPRAAKYFVSHLGNLEIISVGI